VRGKNGLVEVNVQDLRVFTKDRHRTVDDRPFGGGEGMVLKPEPLFEAVESLLGRGAGDASKPGDADLKTAIVLMSAAGKIVPARNGAPPTHSWSALFLFAADMKEWTNAWTEHLATEEISVGDFVLSGGELPAMMIVDAVTRLLPGGTGK